MPVDLEDTKPHLIAIFLTAIKTIKTMSRIISYGDYKYVKEMQKLLLHQKVHIFNYDQVVAKND